MLSTPPIALSIYLRCHYIYDNKRAFWIISMFWRFKKIPRKLPKEKTVKVFEHIYHFRYFTNTISFNPQTHSEGKLDNISSHL